MAKKIYISAGHSANNPGAVKFVVERDEVWKLANMTAEEVRAMGLVAYRDGWDYSWRQTVDEANRLGVDLFVELHLNAGEGKGAEVIIHNINNQYIADYFRAAFARVGQNWRRTIIDPSFLVLKYTNMPACIVESAFVDNWNDIKQFDSDAEKRMLAKKFAKAIAQIVGVKVDVSAPSKPTKPNRTIASVYNASAPLTAKQAMRAGQAISNIILGTNISEDGIDGPATQKNRVKILQWAMNKDYLVNIAVDGIAGSATKNALGQHTVRQGETQYMVTALEVLLLMNGYNPHGVEIPGGFGSGLGRCVLQYQTDHSNLANDRIAGRQTFLQLIK